MPWLPGILAYIKALEARVEMTRLFVPPLRGGGIFWGCFPRIPPSLCSGSIRGYFRILPPGGES
jgi:hypothetical protein